MTFIAHILSISAFGILVSLTFTPRWVGWTCGLWAFIVSMSMLGVIKYYMTYYRIGTIVKLSLFFGVLAFVVWAVCFIILVTAFVDSTQSIKLYWGLFLSLLIFYPVVIVAIIVMLKYKDKGKEGMTTLIKAVYILGGIAILALGVFPIILWEWYSFGGGFVFIAIFVILHCFFPSKMNIFLPIMTGVLVIYTIIVISIQQTAESILEGFSLVLLAAFAYTFFIFVGVYRETKK